MTIKIKHDIKKIVPSFLYKYYSKFITNYYKRNPDKWQIKNWEISGKPIPPPHYIKFKTILNYGGNDCNFFIETGTYMGEMVSRMQRFFDNIITIELDEKLHASARDKFSGFHSITCLKGDSGKVLKEILADNLKVNACAVFWLDGHYSGETTARGILETPILKELEAIQLHIDKFGYKHKIFIDDAHCFNGTSDYPTIEEMENFRHKFFPNYRSFIENNIIIWLPSEQ